MTKAYLQGDNPIHLSFRICFVVYTYLKNLLTNKLKTIVDLTMIAFQFTQPYIEFQRCP